MDKLAIYLPGVTILGAPRRDARAQGLYVAQGGFTGWEGLPSGRRDAVDIPFQHGEFDLPVFRGPRVVSLKGHALAGSAFELAMLGRALTAVGADGGLVDMTVDHQGSVQSVAARVIEAPFTDEGWRGHRALGSWSMQLVCPDPRKYGIPQAFTGNPVDVWHDGNFPATPSIRVSGTAPSGYTITGPGNRQIMVTQALASGSPHTVDVARGGLTVGSTRVQGGITTWQPFTIPPGRKVSVSVSDGLAVTVSLIETFI